MKVRIGTRGSALALRQARFVASLLCERRSEVQTELVIIKTTGDKALDAPLAIIGGKGLFTKEIEEALLDGRVDVAVHSMKDLPTVLPPGLKLAAIIEREDPRDAFISADGRALEDLAPGSVVGTSSLRRRAFLLHRFPRLETVSIRGNVETRIRKISERNLAGALLAVAGMKRMGFAERITSYLAPDVMIPAVGQGAIGLEIRDREGLLEELCRELNHAATWDCVQLEREFLRRLGGGCQVPIAAHAVIDGETVLFSAAVAHPDGHPMVSKQVIGRPKEEGLGERVADELIDLGAAEIMKSVLGEDWRPC
jgi:hydroxymethylbilane synthase